jgi:hypothetical protein
MTRDEAVAIIQFDLGRRTDLEDEIIAKMQEAQRILEQGATLPWFLKEEDASLVLPVGSADVAFPTGFLREIDDEDNECFHYTGDDPIGEVYLEKIELRNGTQRFADVDDGRPRAYAIRKASWKFFPGRDIEYTLTYSYWKSATSLATETATNAWLVYQPTILIGMAGASIAHVLGHERAKAKFDADFARGWKAAFGETVMRQEANRPRHLNESV